MTMPSKSESATLCGRRSPSATLSENSSRPPSWSDNAHSNISELVEPPCDAIMRCDWAGAPSKLMTRAMSIQSLYDDHIPDGTRETQRDHLTIFERPVPSLPRRSVKGRDDHEGLVRLFLFSRMRVWHRGQRNCPNAVAMPNNDFPSSSVSLPPITAVT